MEQPRKASCSAVNVVHIRLLMKLTSLMDDAVSVLPPADMSILSVA